MASGMRVWDASGNLVFDSTAKLARRYNVIIQYAASGTITDANMGGKTPWVCCRQLFAKTDDVLATDAFQMVISKTPVSNKIDWSFSNPDTSIGEAMIVYGANP